MVPTMLSRRDLVASGVVGATAHARAAHEPRLWVHASLMAQPAFAALPLAPSRAFNVEFHLYFTIAYYEII